MKLIGLVIIFNRDFPTKSQFVNEILDGMKANGRCFRDWLDSSIPVRVTVHPSATDQLTASSIAIKELRLANVAVNVDQIGIANFQGSSNVKGNVISQWLY